MTISKQLLQREYSVKHHSAKEIATNLNISENQVWYWLAKYKIPIRSRSEANYFKYNPTGDPYCIKNQLTSKELNLLYLALGLFWGEGNKRSTAGVRIGNSDPQLLKLWCDFLRNICGVNESKIRFHLQLFKDMSPPIAIKFWSQHLNIGVKRINIAKPLSSMGKGTYKKISRYGVMTIGVYNVHFLSWIMEQLKKLGYNPEL